MTAAPARRPLTRRALVAAVTAFVVVVSMLSMETAYALWQDQTTIDAGTISTGTAELTAQWSENDDPAVWQNLLPGDAAQRDVTVANTGDVPLALHAADQMEIAGIELHVAEGPELSATHQPLSKDGAPLVLEPGETVSFQVTLTATPKLVPGQQTELTIELEGRQVA